jgi:hypothetical protein
MEQLTGISGGEWLVLFVVAVALALIVTASLQWLAQPPTGRGALLPLLTGAALLVCALVWHGDLVPHLLKRIVTEPWALATAGAILVLALAVRDFVFGRVLSVFTKALSHLRLSESASGSGALGLSLTLLLVFGGLGLEAANTTGALAPAVSTSPVGQILLEGGASIVASYQVSGSVMDLVLREPQDGFMSMADGEILHFRLPDMLNGKLQITTVASGLGYPRGLAIRQNTLFVSDVVGFPCKPPWLFCDGPTVGPTPQKGELKILGSARGQVLAFDIDPSGHLSNERVVVGDLPVVSSLHAVNGLAVGPDGLLYAVIGNIDYLWKTPHAIDGLNVPNLDLLGTVVRMAPDGSNLQVFARGIRNIYGLAFDERGALYGVDNDGPTVGGWRREEVLHIRRGANYGYPFDGTFGTPAVRTDQPIWLLTSTGSAAIAWRGQFGMSPGLLVGSCGKVESVRLSDLGDGRVVRVNGDYQALADHIPGCVTAIEPMPDHRALLGIFPGGTKPFPLLLMDLSGVR